MPATESPATLDMSALQLGPGTPRGARNVLSRFIKGGARVPLFFGQTLIHSLRDLGYNSTTSAVCEHVDNAIQWGASEIRVYFHQTGKRGGYRTDVLVLDNGVGMPPNVLKTAIAFGGSMVYENRTGIGRYGMGMKAAALSMGPVMEVYSWQEPGMLYTMTLDVSDVGNNRADLIELNDPQLTDMLPSELSEILCKPMVSPKDPETQELFAYEPDTVMERLGASGTIVYIPNCDRLTSKRAQTLCEHATKDMARIYRRQLEQGLTLFINNRQIEPFDPMYWMPTARHTRVEGLGEKRSRLVKSTPIAIPSEEGGATTYPVTVRLYALPIEAWSQLSTMVRKHELHLYEDHTVSFMRNDREVAIGTTAELVGKRHSVHAWMRLQIDFTANLDEAFGVAVNKQGVRPKKYVLDLIRKEIREALIEVREHINRHQAEQASLRSGSKASEAEQRATEADPLQGKRLPAPETEEERHIQESNLRVLAVGYKRQGETDEEAYERIKHSTYIIDFKYDAYWPFYHTEFKYGKLILTINTAHAFFTKLYEPLSKMAHRAAVVDSTIEGEADSPLDPGLAADCNEALIALQLLLFSLARTQAQMTLDDDDGEHRTWFENFRREWSATLDTQLAIR